jgi:hypothetical protein
VLQFRLALTAQPHRIARAAAGIYILPGAVLVSGKDATEDFEDVGHSDEARSMMAEKNDSGIKIVGTIEGEVPESMKAAKSEDVRPAPASCRVGFERFLRPSARSVQLLKILDNLPAFSLFLSLPSLPSAPPLLPGCCARNLPLLVPSV